MEIYFTGGLSAALQSNAFIIQERFVGKEIYITGGAPRRPPISASLEIRGVVGPLQ